MQWIRSKTGVCAAAVLILPVMLMWACSQNPAPGAGWGEFCDPFKKPCKEGLLCRGNLCVQPDGDVDLPDIPVDTEKEATDRDMEQETASESERDEEEAPLKVAIEWEALESSNNMLSPGERRLSVDAGTVGEGLVILDISHRYVCWLSRINKKIFLYNPRSEQRGTVTLPYPYKYSNVISCWGDFVGGNVFIPKSVNPAVPGFYSLINIDSREILFFEEPQSSWLDIFNWHFVLECKIDNAFKEICDYNIHSGERRQITHSSDPSLNYYGRGSPKRDDCFIMWIDNNTRDIGYYGELNETQHHSITDAKDRGNRIRAAAISQGNIAFIDGTEDGPDRQVGNYIIDTGLWSYLTSDDGFKLSVDIDYPRIVYSEILPPGGVCPFSDGDPQWCGTVYIYDLEKKQRIKIPRWIEDHKDIAPSYVNEVGINGRWVVYSDARFWGTDRPDYPPNDIILFDLCTLDMYEHDPMCREN